MAKSEKKGSKPVAKAAEPFRDVVSENRKALYRFEVLDTLECGIVLVGSEVKSLHSQAIAG